MSLSQSKSIPISGINTNHGHNSRQKQYEHWSSSSYNSNLKDIALVESISSQSVSATMDSYYLEQLMANGDMGMDSPPTPPKYVPSLSMTSPFLRRLRHISSVPIPLNTTSKSLYTLKEFVLQKIFVHNLELHEFFTNKIEKSFMSGKLEFSKAMSYHLNIEKAYNEWKNALYSLYDDVLQRYESDSRKHDISYYFENSINERKEIKDFKVRVLLTFEEVCELENQSPEMMLKILFEEFAQYGKLKNRKVIKKKSSTNDSSSLSSIYKKSNEIYDSMKNRVADPKLNISKTDIEKDTQEIILDVVTSDFKLPFINFHNGFQDLFGKREWTINHDLIAKQLFLSEAMFHSNNNDSSEVKESYDSHVSVSRDCLLHSSGFQKYNDNEISNRASMNSPNTTLTAISAVSSTQLHSMSIDLQGFTNIFLHLLQLIHDRINLQSFKDRLMNALNAKNMTIHDLFGFFDKERLGEIDLLLFKDGLKNDFKIFLPSDYISCDVDSLLVDWFLSMDIEGTGEVNEEYFESNLCDIDIIPLLKRKIRYSSRDLEHLFLKEFNGDLGSCSFQDFRIGCHSIGIKASSHVLRILFNQIDEDASESISLKEFVDAIGYDHSRINALKEVILHKVYSINISLQQFFNLMDRKGVGYVSQNELRWSLRNLLNLHIPDKVSYQLIKIIDPQNTNAITFETFSSCISDQLEVLTTKQRILLEAERRGDSLLDLFSRFDDDKSGDISMEELKLGLRVYCGIECDGESLNNLFSSMDLDGNGICDFEEFESTLRDVSMLNIMRLKVEKVKHYLLDGILQSVNAKRDNISLNSLRKMLNKLYESMDRSGNNSVEYYTFRDTLEHHVGVFEDETSIRLLFDEMDSNGQGFVNQDEFTGALTQFFELNELVQGIRLQGSLQKTFVRFLDVDRKGVIDFGSFSKGISRLLTVSSCRNIVLRVFFNKADTSGRGLIQFKDFERVCMRDWSTHQFYPIGVPEIGSRKILKLARKSSYYANLLEKLNHRHVLQHSYIPPAYHCFIDGETSTEKKSSEGEEFLSEEEELNSNNNIQEKNTLSRTLDRNCISEHELEQRIVSILQSNEKLSSENYELRHLAEHLVNLHRLRYTQTI